MDRGSIPGQHTVGAQQDCPPGPPDHSANIIKPGPRQMTRSGDPEGAPVFPLRDLEGGRSWRRAGEGGDEPHPMPDALPPGGHVVQLSRQTQPGASLPAQPTRDPSANRKSRQAPGLPRVQPAIRD